MTDILIRTAASSDIESLYSIAEKMGSHKKPGYFERCLKEQEEKKRAVLVAEQAGQLIGYTNLVWTPSYALFKRLGIPEIQDLNVISTARRQGSGRKLVEACEALARKEGKTDMGIAVGLYSGYGAAQRLYVKMGYIPDGAGACYDDVPVRPGELKAIDDELTLKFTKSL